MPTDWQSLLTPAAGKTQRKVSSPSPPSPIQQKVAAAQAKLDLKVEPPKEAVKTHSCLSLRLSDDSFNLPSRCYRGQLEKPKLMVLTESSSLWESQYNFAFCGDAGFELDRALSEAGVDTGNFKTIFEATVSLLREERKDFDDDVHEFIEGDYLRGEVLFYHINNRSCLVQRDGKNKVKEMTDEDYYHSLSLFHKLVCEVQPSHILVLGGGAFEKIFGKTNVAGYAGVTFDYSFPDFLQQCIDAGSQDPELLRLKGMKFDCLVDVDLHPAFILQNARQVSSWNLRLRNLAGRLGQKQAPADVKTVIFRVYDEAVSFLQKWIADPVLQGLSYDWETTSLCPCAFLSKSITLTCNLARDDDENTGYCVPTWHKDVDWSTEQRVRVSELLGELLLKPREITYGHNLLFDNLVSRKDPYAKLGKRRVPGRRLDSMLLAYVSDETGPQGLKDLCNIHTDLKNYDAPLEEWKKAHKWNNQTNNYGDIPLDILGVYGCYDAVANIKLTKALRKILVADQREGAQLWKVASVLMPVQAQALEDLPFWGQQIDKDYLFETRLSHEKVIEEAISALLGTEEMKSFIEMRIVERSSEFAIEELHKPLNCSKAWMTLHPSANKTAIASIFKKVKADLESKFWSLSPDGDLISRDGERHEHSAYVSEVFMHFAALQYDRDSGDKPHADKKVRGQEAPVAGQVRRYIPNFNTNGAGEMGRFFYEHLDLPIEYKTETGAPSLNEEALTRLTELNPMAKSFADYKGAEKERSTYIQPLVEAFQAFDRGESPEHGMSADGIAHYEVYLGKVVTGRTSAQLIQLIPRAGKVKKFFKSRFKHGVIIQSDLSQIELRTFSAISQDLPMRQVYLNGEDLHMQTTLMLYGDRFRQADKKGKKEMRVAAKKTNFGLVFGVGAQGLMKQIKADGVEVLKLGSLDVNEVYDRVCRKLRCDRTDWRARSKIEAEVDKIRTEISQGILDTFFAGHTRALDWIKEVHDFTKEHGYYYTPFGRIRRLPAALNPDDHQFHNEALRQAQNFPVQSSASDITVVALAALEKELYDRGFKAVPCLAVHDMLGIDSPIEEAAAVADLMGKWMNDPHASFNSLMPGEFDMSWLDVPVGSDAEIGPTWGEPYVYKDGKLKVADADEGAPETIWLPVDHLWDWKEQQKKAA
jgi:DNA polymerase I-like protein with 3'-5' exonuclease and polymerase domains